MWLIDISLYLVVAILTLQTIKDLLVEIKKLRADALARIGDSDLRKALRQQYLLTWQACDRWVIYHQVLSENP